MKLKQDFVLAALAPDANVAELCREHGISRKTGYKWLERFREGGLPALEDMSRRPHTSPRRARHARRAHPGDALGAELPLRAPPRRAPVFPVDRPRHPARPARA